MGDSVFQAGKDVAKTAVDVGNKVVDAADNTADAVTHEASSKNSPAQVETENFFEGIGNWIMRHADDKAIEAIAGNSLAQV